MDLRWLLPVGLCCAVALTAVIVLSYLTGNTGTPDPGASPGIISDDAQSSDFLCGLPVENFILADMNTSGLFDRIGVSGFESFFELGVDMFVLAEVTHIERDIRQTSTLKIIDTVWRRVDEQPATLTAVQWFHAGIGDENTNLLREGGLYLLPLGQEERADERYWYVMGDFDVLFEVDDHNRVWSHSQFEGFNRHDGRNTEIFIKELKYLFSNDDFRLVCSPLGRILHSWALADITIKSRSAESVHFGTHCFYYSFSVNEVLSEPGSDEYAPPGSGDKIIVFASEADSIPLAPGKRYLIFLHGYDGGLLTVSPGLIARIGFCNKITAIPGPDDDTDIGASVFTAYNGYKVDAIRKLAFRINAWRQAYEQE